MNCFVNVLLLVHATSFIEGHPAREGKNDTGLSFLQEEPEYEVLGLNESDRLNESAPYQHVAFFVASNDTNFDHLENFHDFSAWNKEDIHEFNLYHENDVFGNEFTFLDQLAVESEQNVATVVPHKSQDDLVTENVEPNITNNSNPGIVQVNVLVTNKSDHLLKNENNNPEVEDDTIRLQSGNVDRIQGMYSDIVDTNNDVHENDDDHFSSVLEHKNRQNEILLNEFQERFEKNPKSLSTYFEAPSKDLEYPLISILKIDPYSVTLLVKPITFDVHTMVRLMYERVPLSKPALPQHLDDPVIEYVQMYREEQEHRLYNLPVGKYIVCGEAFANGNVIQANCVEALVEKHSKKQLQGGVVCVIAIAMLVVFSVIVYSIYHRLVIYKLEKKS